eukprot:5393366-Prymnesium_polylepis.2
MSCDKHPANGTCGVSAASSEALGIDSGRAKSHRPGAPLETQPGVLAGYSTRRDATRTARPRRVRLVPTRGARSRYAANARHTEAHT